MESDEPFVEVLLRMIADRLPAMLAYWDANQRCRYANRAYETWFGVKPESVIGRDIKSFLGPLYALNQPHIEAALRGEEQQFERDIPNPMGGPPRNGETLYIPDHAPDGTVRGFMVLVVDVSRRKRAEDALRTMERQLEASERLTSLGTLAAGIAHEINNPLAVVMGNVDLVLENEPPPPDREALEDALASARRIADIVQSMRLLARREPGEREVVDINETLEQSTRLASNVLKYRARLVFDLHDVPAVLANASQLAQVFVNLLVNAAQAFAGERGERDEIRIATRHDETSVVIEISDTGCGIPEELQHRIFEPFFTMKDVGHGMGLGLSLSRGIITAFGGELAVRSQVGAGSTFRITLPVVREVGSPASTRVRRRTSGPRMRILLVDDDAMVAANLHRVLSAAHDVTMVCAGHDAIALLDVDDPPFDVILCDLMMPGVSGAQVFQVATSKRPTLVDRFIMMTGGAFTTASRAFLETVRVPVLDKPFTIQKLREVLEAHRLCWLEPVE